MLSRLFRSRPISPSSPPDEQIEALWAKVKRVLSDPKYDLFSYSGIAEKLDAPTESVKIAVHAHLDEVRLSLLLTAKKEMLFALASRPRPWRVTVASTLAALSGNLTVPR